MSAISIACFLCAAGIVVSALPRSADPFSPGRVFALIWFTAIGLADLKLSFIQHTWSLYSWLVLIIGVSSLLLGIFASTALTAGSPRLSIAEVRARFRTLPLNEPLLFRIILALFAVYLFGYVAEVLLVGYIPIFSARPDRARVDFGIFGLHLLVTTLPAICFLVLQYVLLVKGKRPRKLILGLVFAVTFFTFFLLLQRFLYMTWALMAFVLVYYTGHRIKFRHVLLVGAVFIGFLFYIQSIRVAVYVEHYTYVVSRMKFPVAFAAFTEPYMYIVMNLENYTHAVDLLNTFTLGYFTADTFVALSGLKHALADYFGIIERPFVHGYNTFPMFFTYYYDFGVLGVAVFPLILGFVFGRVYHALRSRPGFVSLAGYAVAFYTLMISFFTNPFSMLTTVSNVVLLLLVEAYLARASGGLS